MHLLDQITGGVLACALRACHKSCTLVHEEACADQGAPSVSRTFQVKGQQVCRGQGSVVQLMDKGIMVAVLCRSGC